MSLWGNKDLVASAGTININLATKTITGSGTTFVTDGVSEGDVIVVGAGATYGYAVIASVTNSSTASIASTSYFVSGITTVPSGTSYFVTQSPSYTLHDSIYRAPQAKTTGFSTSPVTTAVFGVDPTEVSVANAASGNARKYAPTHAGWVGVTTYIDTHGNLRVKTETLVAGGSITTDAADDTRYPDS